MKAKMLNYAPQGAKKFARLILNKFGISIAEWKPYLWDISQIERIVEYGWVLQNLEGSKILDVGCWGSLFPIQLASLGYKVVGVDLRDYPHSRPNFEFIKGDVLDSKTQKEIAERGEFNTITLISTLEHVGILLRVKIDLNADIKLLTFCKQLLAGGCCLITVPFGKEKILKRKKQSNEEFPDEWVPWCRIYDENRISKFSQILQIEKIEYFKEDNGNWMPTTLDVIKDIEYPELDAKSKLLLV